MRLKNNSSIIRRKDEGSFFNPATFEIYQMNETGNAVLDLTEDEIEYHKLVSNVLEMQICTADEIDAFIKKCTDKDILVRLGCQLG